MFRLARTAVIAAVLVWISPDPAGAWLRRFAGSRFVVDDQVVATAVDSRGDVVAATATSADPGTCGTIVTKRDGRSGRTLWERTLDGCHYAYAVVTLDARDDVVIGKTGFEIVKLAGTTGEVLWRNRPAPDQKWSSGSVYAVAVDAAGDVVAAGDGIFNPGDDEDHDFVVVKVRGATGERVWDFSIDGEFAPCPPDDEYCHDDFEPFDYASALALDPSGIVYAAGSWEHYRDGGFTVVALDGGSGEERWRHARPGGVPSALVAGPDALYVGGYLSVGPIVMRLDPATGAEGWVRALGSAGGWVSALVPHASGDVLAGGFATSGGGPELFVARVRPDGHVKWQQPVPAPTQLARIDRVGLAPGAADTVGVLVSTASRLDPDAAVTGAEVSLLDAKLGATLWRIALDRSRSARGWALAARADGDLVTGGAVRNPDTGLDATMARLRAADGATAWRVEEELGTNGGADGAGGVAIDAAGNAFVVGSLHNALPTRLDLGVVKLDRAGREIWRSELDGTGSFGSTWDSGSDVTLDSRGDPVVAGRLGSAALVKLDGTTGAERWRRPLASYDFARYVAADARDDVAAVLYQISNDRVGTVWKLSGATGGELWRHAIDVGSLRFATTIGLAFAPDGTAVTASHGWDDASQRTVGVIVAFAADTGAVRWRRVLPGTDPRAICVDAAGRVVVGVGLYEDFLMSDAAVLVLDAATGADLRRTVLTPPEARPALAAVLAFDAAGGVAVGGWTGTDAFAARLDARGAVAWSRVVRAAEVRAGASHVTGFASLAFEPRGGVVFGFGVYEEGHRFDWALVGLRGRSGKTRWRRTLDGDATDPYDADDDTLADLAVTPQGDVVAAGTTSWLDTASDFTVLSLRARNGRDRRAPRDPVRATVEPPPSAASRPNGTRAGRP